MVLLQSTITLVPLRAHSEELLLPGPEPWYPGRTRSFPGEWFPTA